MDVKSLITLFATLACIELSTGFPFPPMFSRRSGRPRTRLFGNSFPSSRSLGARKKPASRPFTIPGFEQVLGGGKSDHDLLGFDTGLRGRALIDPIAGLYDPPLNSGGGGGGGGDIFVSGDFGFDRQGGLSRSGFDVGGNIFNAPSQDQFINGGNLGGSQNLRFIDQGNSGIFQAANSRNVGVLDMNSGLRQPMDVSNFGNQMSIGNSDLFNGGSLGNGGTLGNGGSLGNSGSLGNGGSFGNSGSLGNNMMRNFDNGPGNQLGLGNSNLGLDVNQFGIGNGGSLNLDTTQGGLGSSQIQLGQSKLGLNQNQIGLSNGNQMLLRNSQNFLPGDGLSLSGNQINQGQTGLLSRNLQVNSNQLDFGNQQLGTGSSQMSLRDTSLLDGGQMLSGLNQLGTRLQDQVGGVGPTQISLTNTQFLAPTDQVGGVGPTQMSLTNTQFLAPTDQTLTLNQQGGLSQGQLGSFSGTSNGQLQLGSNQNLDTSLTSQFDSNTMVGNQLGSTLLTSQLNQPMTGQGSGGINSQLTG